MSENMNGMSADNTADKTYANTKYKDTFFRYLFKEKSGMLELYNALFDDCLTDESEIEDCTIEDVFTRQMKNDLAFRVRKKRVIVLTEHQSTLNENMPLRFLMYLGRTYNQMMTTNAVYKERRIELDARRCRRIHMEQLKAVILAAGKGTRMKSDLPKVVHTIEGKCLVDYAIEAAIGAGAEDICLVVGYKYEVVRETILHQEVNFVLQEEQLGTGHAVRCAKDFLGDEGQTMILFGDTPLITAETLKRLREYHTENKNTVTVLSAMVEDPTGYGRIIRDADGNFVKSVEHKDASEEERASHEINSGMYIFDTRELKEALEKIQPNNAQGEYYLPDTLTIIKDKGLKVDAFALSDPEDIMGVNDQEQLKSAAEIIRRRNQAK